MGSSEKQKEIRKQRISSGLCMYCGKEKSRENRRSCAKCAEANIRGSRKWKIAHDKLADEGKISLSLPSSAKGRSMKIPYEIGKKYGKLTVLERIPHKKGYIYLVCQCDCGKQTKALWSNILKGKTDSCGCSRIKIKDRNEAVFNRAISGYKGGAKIRNLSWELSREVAVGLLSAPCTYCGVAPTVTILPPSGTKLRRAKKPQSRSDWPVIFRNGIDRLDNNLGYTAENCIPCCFICNRSKWILEEKEFLEWIARVYHHSVEPKEFQEAA